MRTGLCEAFRILLPLKPEIPSYRLFFCPLKGYFEGLILQQTGISMKHFALLLTTAFFALAPFANAEEPKEPKGTYAEKSSFVLEAEEFSKDFDETSKRHFTMILSNHNLTEVVKTVAGDVEKAVGKCGEANPDMKVKLEETFKGWGDAIAPSMKEAEANIDNMLEAQDIRALLKTMDNERTEKEKGIEKNPVSSKEACVHLQKTLGQSQEQLIKLLNSTLVSLPQVVQGEAEKKKREEAEAQKAAEKKPAEAPAE